MKVEEMFAGEEVEFFYKEDDLYLLCIDYFFCLFL